MPVVDRHYRLLPATRAFLARRRRAHGFHLFARPPSRELHGAWERLGPTEWEWRPRRPLGVQPHERLDLGQTPEVPGGLIAAAVLASAPARVEIHGERLPEAPAPGRRPLSGTPAVVWGAAGGALRAVRFTLRPPGPADFVERHPVHLALHPGESLTVPLAPWRSGQRVEQLAVHWGSVAYRDPEPALPLGAWGYPYYRDGVLGDVSALHRGWVGLLARGKFLEFDEVESIRGFPAAAMEAVRIDLRARDGHPSPPVCRVAAIEVRYRCRARPLCTVELGRWVKPAAPLRVALPRAVRLTRVDIAWRDEGPAMGAVEVAGARSALANVCSGDTHPFDWFGGTPADALTLHARFAPWHASRLAVYGSWA